MNGEQQGGGQGRGGRQQEQAQSGTCVRREGTITTAKSIILARVATTAVAVKIIATGMNNFIIAARTAASRYYVQQQELY